ncbi:hypothetical protein [Eoetvoesiella caeni]|uniref:Uncharacterized protein n=1 Tax=Eoetvoesiella caeni TaxID=645616 RepID=A0A366HAM0_9BURK|nr:hypothetical protein [Eoetvoesiella caeni]MCI2809375.1 hypothetical protein [Eoetvoesiella caeni]NYT54516.1 hypothetical protein [Eoetvoesiella caeni]RBP39294.1 hypothetical protein DFR37_10586 [Eoetvoesiella caeni]
MTLAHDNDGLFETAHNALLFAFNFSNEQYDRPLMNRYADDPVSYVSKELSGMDGAGQAGIIMSRLMGLPPLYQYIIFAKYAPQVIKCDCDRACCRGYRDNRLWLAAISEISSTALREALSGCISHRVLRDGIVKKLFERKKAKHKIVLSDLAERCGVPQRTALDQSAKIRRWYHGANATKNHEAIQGHVQRAELLAENLFESCGIVKVLD